MTMRRLAACIERHDQALVVLARVAGTARQRLRRNASRDARVGKVARVAQELTGFEVPVLGEHRLQLECDRTDQPHVELFVVEPGLECRSRRDSASRCTRLRRRSPRSCGGCAESMRPVFRRKKPTRSVSSARMPRLRIRRRASANTGREPSESASTRHTSPRSTARASASITRAEVGSSPNDVIEQVHVIARGIDVGDEAVDGAVVVGQDARVVAAEDRELAPGFPPGARSDRFSASTSG